MSNCNSCPSNGECGKEEEKCGIQNNPSNKIKNIIGFQGIIINNIKIKEENCKYPIELEYEKYKAEIIKKIYNGEYILIGNNGKIDKKEI